jgi:hypothetical protein
VLKVAPDDRADALRQLEGLDLRGPLAAEPVLGREQPDDLVEEERVAAGDAVQLPDEATRDGGARP